MSITYLPGKEPHPRETRRILKNVNREGWNTSIDCYPVSYTHLTLPTICSV